MSQRFKYPAFSSAARSTGKSAGQHPHRADPRRLGHQLPLIEHRNLPGLDPQRPGRIGRIV
jgi:hypothetical protein